MKHKTLVTIGSFAYSFLMVASALYLLKNNHIISVVVFSLLAIMTATFKVESDGEAPDDYDVSNAKKAYIVWFFVKMLIVILTVASVMIQCYILTGILMFLIVKVEEPVKIYDEEINISKLN